jgi:hypothetical protein
MSSASPAVLALALALGAGVARADVLVGANGDRLSGRLLEQGDGRIVFLSDLLGRVEVPSASARVEPDAVRASPPRAPAADAAARPGPWSIDLGATLGMDRGNLKSTEDKLDTSLVLVRHHADGELNGVFKYQYKRTDGELRNDDWTANLGYDRFLSARRFGAAGVTSTRELTNEGYDLTRTLSLATGWRLWETPRHYLRVGPALGYLSLTRAEERFDGPALGLYARARTPLFGNAVLTGELQFLDSLSAGRYANLELRVRHPLGERLYVAAGWTYAWSDFDIESGFRSEWRWDIGWQFGPADPK